MPNLYRRKDSPYLWCWGHYPNGERWTASTRQRGQREAEKAARAIERERLTESQAPYPTVSLHEALEVLRKHKERKRAAPATIEKLRQKRAPLERLFGSGRDVQTLSLADTEAYLDARRREKIRGTERTVCDHTIAMELTVLCSALRQLRRHDLYGGDPKALWPEALHDVYTPRDRWLPVEQFRALLAELPATKRKYVVAYAHTGVRFGELYTAMRQGDLLIVAQRKGRVRAREIPLSPELRAILDADPLPWKPWAKSHANTWLKKAAARAELAPVSCNDLRRTFASWLCNAGVPELTTIKLMGHTSSAMVRRVYAQLSRGTLGDAVAKLPRVTPVAALVAVAHT